MSYGCRSRDGLGGAGACDGSCVTQDGWTREEVAEALECKPSLGHLLEALRPVIEARSARVRRDFVRRGHVAQDVEDLTQDVLTHLLADEGRALRRWNAARGLSLASFVGSVAERHAYMALRQGHAAAASEVPTDHDALAELAPAFDPDPDGAMDAGARPNDACEALAAEVSRKGAHLFRLALLEGLDVNAICQWTGMTRGAVHAWRSRLRRRLHELDARPASRSEEGQGIRLVA